MVGPTILRQAAVSDRVDRWIWGSLSGKEE